MTHKKINYYYDLVRFSTFVVVSRMSFATWVFSVQVGTDTVFLKLQWTPLVRLTLGTELWQSESYNRMHLKANWGKKQKKKKQNTYEFNQSYKLCVYTHRIYETNL